MMVENLLKVIHILEGLQQAEHLRMLNVYVGCNLQRSATDSLRTRTDLGIPKTTVSEILMQDLGMKCVVANFIPQLLLPEQKEHRAAVANDLFQTATNEPDFLKKVLTRDEWWVYHCDSETKDQSSQWKSPGSLSPKKVLQSCRKIKTMLTVLFDWEGVVHHKYTPPGQMINRSTTSVSFTG